MRLTIACAAFGQRGKEALSAARAAASAASAQGADVLVLPGCRWRREDILALSRGEGELHIAACCAGEGLLLRGGEALLIQPSLFGENAAGEDVALYDLAGFSLALLCGQDAQSPAAARLAALQGAGILLCPVEEEGTDAGPWAQVQQNGVYAAVAPSSGEARILCPLCPPHPDGVMARGRPGTMAMAQLNVAEWVRRRLQYDPLSLLNRPFAASVPPPGPPPPPAAPLKVAAVQRQIDLAGGKKKLLASMEEFCRQAKEQNCALIAFPEYNWLDATPFAGKFGSAGEPPPYALDASDAAQLETFFPLHPPALPLLAHAALKLFAGHLRRLALRESRRLAKKYDLVVHGGTFLEKKKRRLYNAAVVAFPDGQVVLQRKLHPTYQERGMGISPGEELSAFSIDGAMFCAPVCMDATYYEPFEAARRAGCVAAILPICNGEPYYGPAARRGAWARAIENCLYIIKPALTGMMLGGIYTGHAGIYGPQGPLARSREVVGDELVVGTLDFEALGRSSSRLPTPNPAVDAALKRVLGGR